MYLNFSHCQPTYSLLQILRWNDHMCGLGSECFLNANFGYFIISDLFPYHIQVDECSKFKKKISKQIINFSEHRDNWGREKGLTRIFITFFPSD